MLRRPTKQRLTYVAFCQRVFCQQSALCIGKSLDGPILHPGITNMNNHSILADLETKVLVFHLSSLSLNGISTDIYLKVIVPVTFHPFTLFTSFHQFSQSAIPCLLICLCIYYPSLPLESRLCEVRNPTLFFVHSYILRA